MSLPSSDSPMTEYVSRLGTPAGAASDWNCARVQPSAPKGMRASGAACGTFSPVADAHPVSPYVGPRPGETGLPSHGGPVCAVAGEENAIAATTSATAVEMDTLLGRLTAPYNGNTPLTRDARLRPWRRAL